MLTCLGMIIAASGVTFLIYIDQHPAQSCVMNFIQVGSSIFFTAFGILFVFGSGPRYSLDTYIAIMVLGMPVFAITVALMIAISGSNKRYKLKNSDKPKRDLPDWEAKKKKRGLPIDEQ